MRQEISQNFWASVNETWEIEPLPRDAGTVLGTVDDRALKQIRLPVEDGLLPEEPGAIHIVGY